MSTPLRGLRLLVLAAVLGPIAAQGAWSPFYDQPGFGTAGRVFALGTWRNELVAGTYKSLHKDGHDFHHLAHFDGERWLPFGPGLSAPVRAVIEFQGELWVGGEFTYAGTLPTGFAARWDGSAWRAAGAGFDGFVWSFAVHNGELYAGGGFTSSGGRALPGVARWDGTAWQPVGGGMTWSKGTAARVSALCSDGGLLYAAGEFDRAGAAAASHVAAWDGTAWRALGGGINNFGYALLWDLAAYRGKIYAGGAFASAGGVAVDNIAAWDGTSWSAVGPGVQGTTYGAVVESLAVFGGDLYVGGTFEAAGTLATPRIARWDGSSFHAVGGVALAERNPPAVLAMAVWDGRLYCGGEFRVAGSPSPYRHGVYHVASWDGTRWAAVGRGLGFGDEVMMLARWRGQPVAGGRFLVAGGAYSTTVAVFDGDDWRRLGVFDGVVHDALEYQGDLYVAGEFYRVDGQVANGVAAYDGTRWHVFGSGPSLYRAHAIAIYRGQLHAGTVGNPRRWNGTAWEDFTPPVTGAITELEVLNGILYLGGSTPFMAGSPNLLAWDGASLRPVGGGVDGAVEALGVFGNDLIAGGRFKNAGGVPARAIARWDGAAWSTFGTGIQGATVAAFATLGGQLHVGGDFSRWQGESADYVARWDGSRWQPLPGGEPNGFVAALLADDVRGELLIGGHFTRVGALDADNCALWQRTPSFTDLGSPLPSPRRAPILWGEGTLAPGTATHLAVSSAAERAPVALVAGARRADVPLLGGTLIPAVAFTVGGVTGGAGTFVLDFPWSAAPPGAQLFLQGWILDPQGPLGLTATNGLWLRVP